MQVCSMFGNNSCRCLDNDVKGPILELKGAVPRPDNNSGFWRIPTVAEQF